MLAGMLITIREGLEAFLITGILLGYAFFKAVRESATAHAQPPAHEISSRM